MSDSLNTVFIDDILRIILSKLPISRLAQLQQVSRDWRRFIHSQEMAWSIYDRELSQALFLVSNRERFIGVIYTNHLVNQNRLNIMPRLSAMHFPLIDFPVEAIVGSSNGLILLVDNLRQLFVVNPRTLQIRDIIGDTRPAWTYGFGWKNYGNLRCNVVVKVLDRGMETFAIFNLNSNQWRGCVVTWKGADWNVQIDEGSSSAFVGGSFLWLGSATLGHSSPEQCVVILDCTNNSVDYISLLPSMRGIALRIGNVGDNIAALWPINADYSCIWILYLSTRMFRAVDILAYPSGVLFYPLCFYNDWARMVMLRQNQNIDLYFLSGRQRITELHFQDDPEPALYNYFPRGDRFQAIAFDASFISPGELQD
ncbi:hypothetical protein ACLB2K_040895 [Fragaria x ananassa]